MKEMARRVFLVLLVVLFIGYLLVTAIYDLTNKKDLHTVQVDEAVEFLVVEHSISGLIPIGKDYYYLGVDDETAEACIIKASKSWYKKNFDESGVAIQVGGITLTSLAKEPQKFEIGRELASRASQLEGLEFVIAPDYCLDLSYKVNAILKLVFLLTTMILVIAGIRLFGKSKDVNSTVAKIYVLLVVIDLIALLKIIL